ncbi:hypothetical protein [Aquabacterium parvum]|uniref:hypothetical protein n=1 Tax=Aquabacterium parvum TaxID=70584 RepID=UPI000718DB99|nr:hypothetical protein [Aquabacterium parvum]
MKVYQLSDMQGGWFAGDFTPTIVHSKDFEVAVKHYQAGAKEAKHHHKVAQEVTVISSGTVRMNGVTYGEGAIVVLEPGDMTDFEAITAATTVVLKTPSVAGDKYLD